MLKNTLDFLIRRRKEEVTFDTADQQAAWKKAESYLGNLPKGPRKERLKELFKAYIQAGNTFPKTETGIKLLADQLISADTREPAHLKTA